MAATSEIDNSTFLCVTPGTPYRLSVTAPDAPLVKKDVLRVGRWVKGNRVLEVTRDVLHKAKDSFTKFLANGNRVPWIWDHDGTPGRVGDVVGADVNGDVLQFTCAVLSDKHKSEFGEKPGDETWHEVSVEIHPTFKDGAGVEYPYCITHLANVLNPVVTNQGPFLRLALGDSTVAKADDAPIEDGSNTFTVDEVKEMLAKAGYVVPEEAVTKGEVSVAFIAMVGSESEPEAESEPPAAPSDEVPAAIDGEPMQMSLLQSKLAAVEAELLNTKKERFEAEIQKHIARGAMHPTDAAIYTKAGEQAAFQLSLLDPIKQRRDSEVVPMTQRGRVGVSSQPPAVAGVRKPMDKNRAKEIVKTVR